MSWSNYQTKVQIQAALAGMDPIAATAAKYLADLLIEYQDRLEEREIVEAIPYEALRRALADAELPGGPSHGDLMILASQHGQKIGDLGIAMALFVLGKKRRNWVGGAVAVAVGVGLLALGA